MNIFRFTSAFYTSFFALLVTLLLLSACAELPIYTSQRIPTNDSLAAPMRFYDKGADVWFDFSNNDSLVIISLQTTNRRTQARILKNGIKFYFSKTQKKNRARYLQYPYYGEYDAGMKPTIASQFDLFGNPQKKLPNKIYWKQDNDDLGMAYELDSRYTDVNIKLQKPNPKTLNYVLAIPIKKIINKDITHKIWAMGISIGDFEPIVAPRMGDEHRHAGGMSAMQGGGMGRGMASRGSAGMGHRDDFSRDSLSKKNRYDNQSDAGVGKIDIWFQLELVEQ